MRVYRFDGEKTLNELVAKIYTIDRKGLTASNVGKRVAQANPHVALTGKSLAKKLRRGALIVAPDVDGAHHTAATRALREEAVDAIPTEQLLDWTDSVIMSGQQHHAVRLRNFARALDAVLPDIVDDEMRKGVDETKSAIDQRHEKLRELTRARLATAERARQALSQQRELLKRS